MNRLLLTAVAMLLFTLAYSQDMMKPEVTEEEKTFSIGTHPAFILSIPETDRETVKDAWLKHMKKAEVLLQEEQEIHHRIIYIKDISSEPLDVTSDIWVTEDAAQLIVMFEENGVYINSETEGIKAQAVRNWLLEFGGELYADVLKDELKNDKKDLKGLEKDLKSLEKDEKKLNKEAGKVEDDIADANSELNQNKNDQKLLQEQIDYYVQEFIPSLNTALGDEKKEAEKTLKDLEKDMKKLKKDEDKINEEIEELKAEKKEIEDKIKAKQDEQKDQKDKIKEQENLMGTKEKEMSKYK